MACRGAGAQGEEKAKTHGKGTPGHATMFDEMRESSLSPICLVFPLLAVGCKPSAMSKIDAEKAALVSGDAGKIHDATAGYPACGEQPYVAGKSVYQDSCLSDIANAFGSKAGFVATPPDNAATATAALILLRDGRGDAFTHADTWLHDLKSAKGTGHDALRLAVARKMEEAAPVVGKPIEGDDASRAALKAVVAAIPGACNTYYLVGNGAALEKMPAALTPDHSACVQKDLSRREGPGGLYGAGVARALEGALSLWRETERALRQGMAVSDAETKAVLEKQLVTIESATRAIKTKQDDASKTLMDSLRALQAAHADAGAIPKAGDAGPSALEPPMKR
jgi:hypothetical protein